jgi:5-methylcytosine-specific restriction endonuclease McrA
MESPTKQIRRRHRLPSIFCSFPWVRHFGPGLFADVESEEDQNLISIYQRLLAGDTDVSEIDCLYSLTLAVDIPVSIQSMTGKSGALFGVRRYGWNLYDVSYLLEDRTPSEAVPIAKAGFTKERLSRLAKNDSYLKFIRTLETYAGKNRGHYFPVELESEIRKREERLAAEGKLNRLLVDLRNGPTKMEGSKKASKAVSESARNSVLQFHDYGCIFDGKTRPEVSLHVHHVIPQNLIKRLHLPERLFTARENLVCACSGCNLAKSDAVSRADVRFYLRQFESPGHPNHPLVSILQKLEELQFEK